MSEKSESIQEIMECQKILDELIEGKKVQQNSAELMNFII